MKVLENRLTTMQFSANDERPVRFSDLVKLVINTTTNGLTIEEVRLRLAILGAASRHDDVIELEDAHADCLVECVQKMSWGTVHRAIVEFYDAVMELNK